MEGSLQLHYRGSVTEWQIFFGESVKFNEGSECLVTLSLGKTSPYELTNTEPLSASSRAPSRTKTSKIKPFLFPLSLKRPPQWKSLPP
jgi:hypothetical protein